MNTVTICHASDREAWLAARRQGIGASEAADLLGLGWGSPLQLYARKLGLAGETEDTEPVWWGRALEPLVGARYAEVAGRSWRPDGRLLASRSSPWQLATLDGWTWAGSDPGAAWPLEIKTARAAAEGEWADGPPIHYRCQLAWQLLVTGAPRATVACLLGGQRLVWCDVERDDALIARLVAAGAELWDRIQRTDPPAPSAADSRVIGQLWPAGDGTVIPLAAELADVDADVVRMRRDRVLLDSRIAEAENRLKMALGAASAGVLPDGVAWTWREQTRAEHVVRSSTFRVLRRAEKRGGDRCIGDVPADGAP